MGLSGVVPLPCSKCRVRLGGFRGGIIGDLVGRVGASLMCGGLAGGTGGGDILSVGCLESAFLRRDAIALLGPVISLICD